MKVKTQDVRDRLEELKEPQRVAEAMNISLATVYYHLSKGNGGIKVFEETQPDEQPPDFSGYIVKDSRLIQRAVYKDIEKILDMKHIPYLLGTTGTGKTAFAEWYSEKHKLPLLAINCDVGTLRELIGRYELIAHNGSAITTFRLGLLLHFLQQKSIILFDEANALEPEYLFFLHELLNNKRIFIREIDRVINVHPESKIILASNPTNSKYSGTFKLNVSLVSRVVVADMPLFTEPELKKILNIKEKPLQKDLIKFYYEAIGLITSQEIEADIGIRELLQFKSLLQSFDRQQAIKLAFTNKVLLTADIEAMKAVENLAKTVLGTRENKNEK